jgi:hypothetical protein
MRKRIIFIQISIVLLVYGLLHVFIILLSNNPSPDVDLFIERNFTYVLSVYIYPLIAVAVNIMCAIFSRLLKPVQRILVFVLLNILNFGLYVGSNFLYAIQIGEIMDKERIILLKNSFPYIIIMSLITFVLVSIMVFIVPRVCRFLFGIIRKKREEMREILNEISKENSEQ